MRMTTAGAIIGAAALCFIADGAQAQSWRTHSTPPPPVPEAWGTVGGYGQPYGRPPEYNYGRPGRIYNYGYGYSRNYGYGHYGHGYGYSDHRPRVRQGYRDEWGYQDDRPHTAPGYGRGDGRRHRGDHYDGCGCPDVYLYDR